ncbi:MAG: serine/threonine protein kinase [Planctomycetes bacterium]|nr:serine/threonine protein kinase [Planctomycetota bacterium]
MQSRQNDTFPDFPPRYRTIRVLGRGGMAVVYEAVDAETGRSVAIKVIEVDQANQQKHRRLLREARALSRLEHPNVVRLLDAGESEQGTYLVMERLEGASLEEALVEGGRDLTFWVPVLAAVARAVHHAHESGILHRDLKPANVILSAGDVPKVIDFGLARIVDSESVLTWTGAVLGTPFYMAPEQVRGDTEAVSPWTDVYALGVMLYEILSGFRPFSTATRRNDLFTRIQEEEPVPPSALAPGVPDALEKVALKALRKRPSERHASALEFATELEAWLAGEGPRGRGSADRCRVSNPWIRRLALLAVAGAAAGLLVWFQDSPTPVPNGEGSHRLPLSIHWELLPAAGKAPFPDRERGRVPDPSGVCWIRQGPQSEGGRLSLHVLLEPQGVAGPGRWTEVELPAGVLPGGVARDPDGTCYLLTRAGELLSWPIDREAAPTTEPVETGGRSIGEPVALSWQGREEGGEILVLGAGPGGLDVSRIEPCAAGRWVFRSPILPPLTSPAIVAVASDPGPRRIYVCTRGPGGPEGVGLWVLEPAATDPRWTSLDLSGLPAGQEILDLAAARGILVAVTTTPGSGDVLLRAGRPRGRELPLIELPRLDRPLSGGRAWIDSGNGLLLFTSNEPRSPVQVWALRLSDLDSLLARTIHE